MIADKIEQDEDKPRSEEGRKAKKEVWTEGRQA